MDRLSKRHEAYRVELPAYLRLPEMVSSLERQGRRLFRGLSASSIAGIIGFAGCGALVVATASLLALSIS